MKAFDGDHRPLRRAKGKALEQIGVGAGLALEAQQVDVDRLDAVAAEQAVDLAPVVGLVVEEVVDAQGQGQGHGRAVSGAVSQHRSQALGIELLDKGDGPVLFHVARGGKPGKRRIGHGVDRGHRLALAGEAMEPQPVGQHEMVGDSQDGAEIDGARRRQLLGRKLGHVGGQAVVGPTVVEGFDEEELGHNFSTKPILLKSNHTLAGHKDRQAFCMQFSLVASKSYTPQSY